LLTEAGADVREIKRHLANSLDIRVCEGLLEPEFGEEPSVKPEVRAVFPLASAQLPVAACYLAKSVAATRKCGCNAAAGFMKVR